MIESRTREESIAGLIYYLAERELRSAAEAALECVFEHDADPRLMLLVIEKSQEGYYEYVSKAEYARQRYAQSG